MARKRTDEEIRAMMLPHGRTIGEELAALDAFSRLLDSRSIQVYIDHVLDLADAAKAHRNIEGGHTRGKIVLRVSDD